jgi:hypothetical protein
MKAKSILRQDRVKVQGTRNDYVPGNVYIFGSRHGRVKVGLSRNVARRRRELSAVYQEDLTLIASVFTFNMKLLENILHEQYAAYSEPQPQHLNGHTEWFTAKSFRIFQIKSSLYKQAFVINFSYVLAIVWLLGFIIRLTS